MSFSLRHLPINRSRKKWSYSTIKLPSNKKFGIGFIDASQILDFKERSADCAVKGAHLSLNGYAKIARILALKD